MSLTSGTLNAVRLDNNTNTTFNFNGPLTINSTTGNGVNLTNNTGATINFTGGFDIDTTTGTGFNATGGGTILADDPAGTVGNFITSTAGRAINLDGITIAGGAGFELSNVTSTGGATGVSINNVDGGTFRMFNLRTLDINNSVGDGLSITNSSATFAFDGTVDIDVTGGNGIELNNNSGNVTFGTLQVDGASGSAIKLAGTNTGTIAFTDVDIGLTVNSSTGFDASGAVINANVSATDFDLTSTSTTGTTGVNLAGTTGTASIVLGELNTNGGADATIAGVNSGVNFTAATNLNFTFGDGDGTTGDLIQSSISAVTPITRVLPTNGTYDFEDVTFTGDISNLQGPTIFFVDALTAGTGATQTTPGTIGAAEMATVDVIALIDTTQNATADNIDLQSVLHMSGGLPGTIDLDDGQVLIALKAGDVIDLTTLGLSGGTPASFLFTGIGGSSTVTGAATLDSVVPILLTGAAGGAVSLAGSAGIQGVNINSTGGDGISGTFAAAVTVIIKSSTIIGAGGGDAIDIATTAGASTVMMSDLTLNGALRLNGAGGGTLTATGTGTNTTFTIGAAVDINTVTIGAAGMTFASIFGNGGGTTAEGIKLENLGANSSFTVTGTTSLDNYTCRAVRILNISENNVSVSFGQTDINTTVGQVAAGAQGVAIFTVSGTNFDFDIGALTVGNATDNSSRGFNVFSVTGAGADIDLASFTSTNVATAFFINDFDAAGSTVTVALTTSITNATSDGVRIMNSSANVTFSGNTTISNNGTGDGVDIGQSAGGANTGTYSFTGLDISVVGVGAFGLRATNSGTLNITNPLSFTNITSNAGTSAFIDPTVVNATFQSLTSSNSATTGVDLTLAGGSTFTVTGSTNINGSAGNAVNLVGQTGTQTVNLGTLNVNNGGTAGAGLIVSNATAGTLNLNSTTGSITTGSNTAVSITNAVTSITLASITGNGGGVTVDGVRLINLGAGSGFIVTGTTTLNNYTNDGIEISSIAQNNVTVPE